MSNADPGGAHRLVEMIRQSGPVDTTVPYDTETLRGKTVLITGGASGFGAAFARHWAKHGANIIIGDVNDIGGTDLVAELRVLSGSSTHHHYQHCDVTNWQSQVDMFQTAVRVSPTRGIDAVVANAGIIEESVATGRGFENPRGLDLDANANPTPPELRVIAVNLIGVLYTVHLALYWLQRNTEPKQTAGLSGGASGGATAGSPSPDSNAEARTRDRHLLLIGSVASILPLPGQIEYSVSKHGVLGLFRSLRGTSWRQSIRVNMLCPYFVDTPLIPTSGVLILAGGALAYAEDVVDAGTRLMADEGIVGRALVVGPKLKVVDGEDGEALLVEESTEKELTSGNEAVRTQAVWECYAHDYDNVELFTWRYVRLLNAIPKIRGWLGIVTDVVKVLFFRKRTWAKRAT